MLWQVVGGRQEYQIALEREDRGMMQWHCTCADHVYRRDPIAGHSCKHIRGLQQVTPPMRRAA